MDPKDLLASAEVLRRIEAACRRRFRDETEADECYVFVLDGLTAGDYKRLRAFQGRSDPKTYVYVLTNSLISDFRRKKYGRRRIPQAVRNLGAWAESVYRFICWEKYSLDAAYELVTLDGLYSGSLEDFYAFVEPVLAVPCPENPTFVSVDITDEKNPGPVLAAAPDTGPLERLLEKLDHERRSQASRVIQKVTAGFAEEDQILIRLVFGSDLSVAAVGRAIGLKPAPARKRLERLLVKIRERLLVEGIREA